MSKVGRNDLCPCGSGKKYKKCCGKTQSLANFKAAILEEKMDYMLGLVFEDLSKNLRRLPMALLSMLEGDFAERPELMEKIQHISNNPEEVFEDVELMPLIECLIFDFPWAEGKTIFEKHLAREQRGLRSFVIDNFTRWKDSFVSIYKVLQIDETSFLLKDIILDQEITIQTTNLYAEEIKVGNFLATRVLAKGEYYDILGYTSFPACTLDQIISKLTVIKERKVEEGAISRGEDWLDFLKRYGYLVLLTTIELANQVDFEDFEEMHFEMFRDSLEWEGEKQRLVARLIEDNLIDEFPLEQLAIALKLWHLYCEKMNPRITKPETLAASVEYLISIAMGREKTQIEVAAKYGVSPSSISSRYGDMVDILAELVVPEEEEGMRPRLLAEESLFEISTFIRRNEHSFSDTLDVDEFIEDNYELITAENSVLGSDKFKAQKLLYDAWNQSNIKKKIDLAKEALKLYPYSADAFNILAEYDTQDIEESIELYRKGIEVGKLDLGEEIFLEFKNNFWGFVETRPYMRAKQGLIESLILIEALEEATEHCEDMLTLNPNDNQGMRYVMVNLYLRTNQLEKARSILEKYAEDTCAEFCYNRLILEYKLSGPGKKAQKLMQEAIRCNPYVVGYFIGEKDIPSESPMYYGSGDENEAIFYVYNNYRLWEENFEFAEWFIRGASKVR